MRAIASHTFEPTADRNIFRFIDRAGDWTHYWIKSKKIFVPAVNHIIRTGYPKGERFYHYLLHATPADAERRLKSAAEEGSRTHMAIRDLIAGRRVTLRSKYPNEISGKREMLNAEEWQNLASFMAWCAKYRPQVLMQERAVWSAAYAFAGTIDFLGTIMVPKGDKAFPPDVWNRRILVLIDWKTSGAIWDEYELQTAAYRKALLEYTPSRIPLKKFGGLWTAIVRLGTAHKSGFEVKAWTPEESDSNFGLFASAYSIFVRKDGMEVEQELTMIPAEFQIRMPKVR